MNTDPTLLEVDWGDAETERPAPFESAPEPVREPAKPKAKNPRQVIAGNITGKLGGMPPRPRDPISEDELAQKTADAILAGKRSPLTLRRVGSPTDDDRKAIVRLTGQPAESFVAKLTAKLEAIAEKTADRIAERLENDEGKLSELSYLLGVSLDKANAISGRQAVANSVNVQINNFGAAGPRKADGTMDRDAVIAALKAEPTQDA